MKPIGAGVAAAVLLWCAAVRAAEPVHAPALLPPESAFPASPSCATCNTCNTCTSCRPCCGGRLQAWLNYRALHRTRCGECSSCCECRWVPLYLYFLGQCKEHPCTACGTCGPQGCGCVSHGVFSSPMGLGMFGD